MVQWFLKLKKKAAEEEPEPEPPLELHEEFITEIKNDETNINEQMFKEYFFLSYSIIFSNYIIAIKL